MVLDPHPWLGLDYRELLPGLQSGQHRFTLALTRPYSHGYGAGALRVVGVQAEGAVPHCVLAYERYHPCRPRPTDGAAERAHVG